VKKTENSQTTVYVSALYEKNLTVNVATSYYLANGNPIAVCQNTTVRFPNDGCYARAHLIAQRMQAGGVPYEAIGKVWNEAGPGLTTHLRVDTPYDLFDTGSVHRARMLRPTSWLSKPMAH
jgi:hypothetical protein